MRRGPETTLIFSYLRHGYECPEPYYWVLQMSIKGACAPSPFCDWVPISGEISVHGVQAA